MAIKIAINYKGIECQNAYHKISGFWSTDKNSVSCTVLTYFDEATKQGNPDAFLRNENYQGLVFDSNDNTKVYTQIYTQLKLLPEFLGAEDV